MRYRRYLPYVMAMAACWSLAGPGDAGGPNARGTEPDTASAERNSETDVGKPFPQEGGFDYTLNLRIFEEFEKAGIEFAFPTRTVRLAGDPKRETAIRMLGKDL